MHHRLDSILNQIRQDVAKYLSSESIYSACHEAGHEWRKCVLNPAAIVHLFVTQVLHGNISLDHISRLSGGLFTASAFCMARSALPLIVFKIVFRGLVQKLLPITNREGLWKGHRTLATDGSSASMSDTPELQKEFGQPGKQKPGCGFPVVKLLGVFHCGTGILLDLWTAPLRSHEMASIAKMHPGLKPGDVLVGDRGFCSFAHLAILIQGGVHAVFRVHQRQIVDFTHNRPHAIPGEKRAAKGLPRSRWLRSLGVLDQVVEWFKPEERPAWMSEEEYANLPATILVRELRYNTGGWGFRTRTVTLVTTLTDAELYSLEELAQLYATRWRVEVNLRHLKTTMKMDVLKCKTVDGVLKELMVYAIAYNLVRLVMVEAARRQGVDVDRISFVDALRWLAHAQPGDELPELVVNPDRPGRYEPRVRKRRPKQYDLMNKPRSDLRKQFRDQQMALA